MHLGLVTTTAPLASLNWEVELTKKAEEIWDEYECLVLPAAQQPRGCCSEEGETSYKGRKNKTKKKKKPPKDSEAEQCSPEHPCCCPVHCLGWGERGLTPISTTTFVIQSSLMGCSVCMTQIMMQLSNLVLPALCAQPHGPASKPDYFPPCCTKLQTEKSIVQETNWPCIRDFSWMLFLE